MSCSENNKKVTNINNVISDVTDNLNSIRKKVYGLYPNFEINEISKIISCINLTETEINKSNTQRIERINNKHTKSPNVLVNNGKVYINVNKLF